LKIVEQIPIIQHNRQPTVAIITAEYCEKVAVDTLIENKETFVRYTTVGKNTKHQLLYSYLIYFTMSSVIIQVLYIYIHMYMMYHTMTNDKFATK